MQEKFIEHVVFKRIVECEKCDSGIMVKTGHSRQNGDGQLYLHKCTGCGHALDLPHPYPDYIFVAADQADEYREKPKVKRERKA